jgi:hypothetical protein
MSQVAPAQLFIVPRTQAQDTVCSYLQTIFCTHNACGTCTTCQLINNKQYHSVLWITPEKRYTLDLLDGIFKRTEFSLEDNQQYFFILEKADFLTPACANSLLKIVEEPPPGYNFIFLAQRIQLVLPTIRSRCTITSFASEQIQNTACPFASHFMKLDSDPHAFLKELGTTTLTEIESTELIDIFLEYWCSYYSKVAVSQNTDALHRCKKMISLFKNAALKPPMPGSTKIFWRNLFLQKELVR